MSARLVGIDFSAVAVELAAKRADHFVAAGQAEFRRGTLERTGLRDECANGVLSVDALPFAADRVSALREARRILIPGGRMILTARERRAGADDWQTMATRAGLHVEQSLVNLCDDEFWLRLYALWRAHEQQLRSELGERATDNLISEATRVPSVFDERRPLVLVMRRPQRIDRSETAPAVPGC
jgi:ubiquinone/menaquinone biosynthesis C-methylase UbiE